MKKVCTTKNRATLMRWLKLERKLLGTEEL